MASISISGNLSAKEEGKLSERSAHVPLTRLWTDKDGNPIPIKYLLSPDIPAEKARLYQNQVKLWSDQSCLKFQKIEKSGMTENDLIGWCYYGEKVKRKEDKVFFVHTPGSGGVSFGISSEGNRCEHFNFLADPKRVSLDYELFAWSLGLMKAFSRPDSKKFMGLNFENFGFDRMSDRRYLNNALKCMGKAVPLAIPLDFMSVTMMESAWYGSQEATPTIVSLDPNQQYLLDYRFRGMLPPSFLDVLAINMMYKCIPKWESSCKESGKEVPKCKNYGYVTKNCTCLCLPSFSGKLCEKKIGDGFPYPTQPGTFTLSIVDDKDYELGKLLPLKTASSVPGAVDDLKYNVFINVKILPKDPKRLPTIKVYLPFRGVHEVFRNLQVPQEHIIQQISKLDCKVGIRLLWGNSKIDGRRLACECFSTLASNETKEYSRVIRGREPNMTVTFVNNIGKTYSSQELSVETSKFHLLAEFHPSPNKLTFRKNRTSPAISVGGSKGSGGEVNGTELPAAPAKGEAMTASGGSGPLTIAVLVGSGLALLLLLCLLLVFLKRRKKKKKQDLGEEEEEAERSGSDSDSDDEK